MDFVVRMKNGQVFLFGTKTENSDSEAAISGLQKGELIIKDSNADILNSIVLHRGWQLSNDLQGLPYYGVLFVEDGIVLAHVPKVAGDE